MKPATEEFLYYLLWTADMLVRPTWRNVTDSFESWGYRNGLGHRLRDLERRKFLEKDTLPTDGERVYRLTQSGRLAALAGVDPPARWSRSWDGRWRLALFDIAETDNRHRVRLRRYLRRLGFGYLQDSVWLSPDPPEVIRSHFAGTSPNVEMLVFFEGQAAGGEGNADLVAGAWPFKQIRETYDDWFRVAAAAPRVAPGQARDWPAIRRWAAEERAAWQAVVRCDPFLPESLLPAGYPGRKAWTQRVHLLNQLGQAI